MVDYSRAATSRAAKSSFDQAAQSLISEIQALQAEYETEWKKVEELRRSRASLIENVIPILKNNEVKLARPLSKCDNTELMEELRNIVNSLDTTPQEEIRVAMVRIDSRYSQLVKQAKKLDALYERLSSYYVPEKDYGEEVVISLKGQKKKKTDEVSVPLSFDSVVLPDVTDNEIVKGEQFEKTQEKVDEGVAPEVEAILEQVSDVDNHEASHDGAYEDSTQTIDLDIDETPLFTSNLFEEYDDSTTYGIPEISFDDAVEDPLEKNDSTTNSYEDPKLLADLSSDDLDFDAMNNYLGSMSNSSFDYNIDNLGNIFQTDDFEDEYSESKSNYSDEGLEQVISSAPASQELINEVETLIDSKKLFSYLDNFSDDHTKGNDSSDKVIQLFDRVEPEKVEESAPVDDEEPEFHIYSLNSDQTLSQIVDYVYEGNITWHDLYRYADNDEVISKRCEEMNVDIEDAVNTPGVLADLDIKYPKNFVPYREESVYHSKAA